MEQSSDIVVSQPREQRGLPECNQRGFTLLEIFITLVIISVLAGLSVPRFLDHTVSARRSDGVSGLTRVLKFQERYFLNNMTYVTDLSELGFDLDKGALVSEEGYYSIVAKACEDSNIARCVNLIATPLGTQADDGELTLSSRGEKTWEGNAEGETGWPGL
ncbi:MAG: prepilin-type N-terminal cleavage/methylation domain-containing protein [Gammaproteobacteria bacterium]|nr:prepilin-type N-terminal cleavage/methylation domain-containing protein [Gammaproteobacteria bacterium]